MYTVFVASFNIKKYFCVTIFKWICVGSFLTKITSN